MVNKKRLVDLQKRLNEWRRLTNAYFPNFPCQTFYEFILNTPTVDAYTEEQVASIIQQADKLEARNNELEKEIAWLKSCLNCKIRKECPRHCGKVVHNCDHWEYGDSTVDAVSRGVHDQVRWERDCAIGQLSSYGISLGEKADAVKVVRCKDCRYYETVEYYPDGTKQVCRLFRRQMQEEAFCSYGERKDNDL